MRHFFCGVIAAESHLKSSQSEQMLHVYCVVPENIHTPTTGGIGNYEGEGGSKTQEIPEGIGVV